MWHRLSTRLILSVVLIEVVMLSILVWNSVRLIESSHAELLESSIKEESRLITKLFAPGLASRDYALVVDSLQLLKDKRGLVYMDIYDNQGRLVGSIGNKTHILDQNGNPVKTDGELKLSHNGDKHVIEVNGENITLTQDETYDDALSDGVFDYVDDVVLEGQHLGEIHAGYSIDSVQALTRRTAIQNTTIAFIALCLMIIVTILLGMFLTRNLRKLEEGAHSVGEGDLKYRIDVVGDDEISDVARSFNRMAEKIEKSSDELDRQVEERTAKYLTAKQDAEDANKAKSDFLSSMSHELRTPLNAILGFAQVLNLDVDKLDSTQRSNVNEILEAGAHLLKLINEVLDLAKIESGKMSIFIEAISLDALLADSLKLMQPQIELRDITVVDNISNNNYNVNADAMRIKQVLLNFLSNAVKYNSESGCITLDAENMGNGKLRIAVTDTGSGLTKDEIAKLFTSFERLSAKSNIEGTGIGLTISKHLTGLMGGTVGVESSNGEGSTFWIELEMA